MEVNKKTLGSRIAECRKNLGMTQDDLARPLNVQRQVISYYENGTRMPNIDDLATMADLFNTTTDYLLGLTDVKSSDTEIINISKYTGLSEKAISTLHHYIDLFGYMESINFLIEYSGSTFQLSEETDDFEVPVLLSKLKDYLTISPKDEKVFNIAESGELLDSKDEKLWEVLTVAEIDTGTLIEQILLNSFVDELKYAKKHFATQRRVKSNANNNETE